MIIPFIRKSVVFLSIWTVIFVSLCQFLPMHYFNGEYPLWVDKMEVLDEPGEYSNFIFGDSRAIAGIDPRELGDHYYNLALGGGTPMEGYFMLRRLLENGNRVDTLIISYAPLHLEQSEMFWDRQMKYRFYDLADAREIFRELNQLNEEFWKYDDARLYTDSKRGSHIRQAYANFLRWPGTLRPELSKSLFLRGAQNLQIRAEVARRKGNFDFGRAKASHGLNVEAQREEFRPKRVIREALEQLLTMAGENNIHVVYTLLPVNATSYNHMTENYKAEVARYHSELAEMFPKVVFRETELKYFEDTCFGDASHVNTKGRERFMQGLLADLKGRKPDPSRFTSLSFEE